MVGLCLLTLIESTALECMQTKGLFISFLFYNWSPARRAIVIGIAVEFRIAWRVFVLCDRMAALCLIL